MDALLTSEVSGILHEQAASLPAETAGPTLTPELLPLDARERVVAFRSGEKTFRHIFRRLKDADWQYFFAHVAAEVKQEKGGGFTQMVDMDTASLMLYGRAIVRVEGYHTRDGAAPETLPTWPEPVPQKHRLTAISLLMSGSQDAGGDDSLLAEGSTVTLNAMWNETGNGLMKAYRGLVHRFDSPTVEHRRRYLRAKNRSFIPGGSRNGTTVIPSAYPVLVKLYEELIVGVEGYGVDGRELIGREEIAREMDGFHKFVAAAPLFQWDSRGEESAAE